MGRHTDAVHLLEDNEEALMGTCYVPGTCCMHRTCCGLPASLPSCSFLFAEVTCWMLTGERQAARLRSQFLGAMLRQEVGYFDKSTNTGAVIGHMSGDILTIREAMGEKVCLCVRPIPSYPGPWLLCSLAT